MAKVGRFVSDPTAGSYCQITFESGEKIVLSHDKGGFKGGRLSIEVSKLLGLRSMRIFDLDLDSTEGKSALAQLTRDAQPRTVEATPLGAFVAHLRSCRSVDYVKAKCSAIAPPTQPVDQRGGDRHA